MRLDATRLARMATVLALIGLGLMVWSVLFPGPISVVVAMSIGQAIGTVSLLLFAAAIWQDSRHV